MSQPVKIAICVATYLRPKGLRRVIESLRIQNLEGIDAHLIVADNDANGSAESVIRECADNLPFPVTYVIEPTRGIPSVRNRLFAEAYTIGAEYIASIDDDDRADPRWLKSLLETAISYQADAVGGQCIYEIDSNAPPHVKNAFRATERTTGSIPSRIGTCNSLYRTSAIRSISGPFDVSIGLSPGSDGLLSETMAAKGFRLVNCGEAIVHVGIPGGRTRVSTILKRGYAQGSVDGRIALYVSPSIQSVGKHFLRSCGKVSIGSLQTLWALLFNRAYALRYANRVMSGLGGLAFMVSRKFAHNQYEIIHGE